MLSKKMRESFTVTFISKLSVNHRQDIFAMGHGSFYFTLFTEKGGLTKSREIYMVQVYLLKQFMVLHHLIFVI